MVATCNFSRAHSARSLDSSICSGVTGLASGAVNLPAADAFTELRSVCSTRPNSLAAHHDAHGLGVLDGLFLELSRVVLLRHLLHVSSFKSRC